MSDLGTMILEDTYHERNQKMDSQTLVFIRHHNAKAEYEYRTQKEKQFVEIDQQFLIKREGFRDLPKGLNPNSKELLDDIYKWVKENPDKVTYVNYSNNGKYLPSPERHKAYLSLSKGCDCGNDPCIKIPTLAVEYDHIVNAKWDCFACGQLNFAGKDKVKYLQTHGNKIVCHKCWRGDYTTDEMGNIDIDGTVLVKDGECPSHIENLVKQEDRLPDGDWKFD